MSTWRQRSFELTCARCFNLSKEIKRSSGCPWCNGSQMSLVELTDAMVEAAILAASRPMDGCGVEIYGGCGGMHTDCYYRAILTAALRAGEKE